MCIRTTMPMQWSRSPFIYHAVPAKVPIIVDTDGTTLIESDITVKYLDDKYGPRLLPDGAAERAMACPHSAPFIPFKCLYATAWGFSNRCACLLGGSAKTAFCAHLYIALTDTAM